MLSVKRVKMSTRKLYFVLKLTSTRRQLDECPNIQHPPTTTATLAVCTSLDCALIWDVAARLNILTPLSICFMKQKQDLCALSYILSHDNASMDKVSAIGIII